MIFKITEWTLLELYKRRNRIYFPVYQRGEVWSEGQKALLVDSIFRGIDIPKLYFQSYGAEEWDCIDGHQRTQAIIGFFDDEFKHEGRTFGELSKPEKTTFENYKLTIAEVTDITEDEVRMLFYRLQLGVPLNAGEKLNAIRSNMGTLVSKMTQHPFIHNISIPTRRYAKEQVCAQLCNNSRFINKTEEFRNSKYEDLENLYRAYADFNLESYEARQIFSVLDKLYELFAEKAVEITNRASVVSIYLMVEEMYVEGRLEGKEDAIADFYVRFLNDQREQARLGIDATNRFLISYQSRVIQAADSKTAIMERHEKLRQAFDYYLQKGKIIGG